MEKSYNGKVRFWTQRKCNSPSSCIIRLFWPLIFRPFQFTEGLHFDCFIQTLTWKRFMVQKKPGEDKFNSLADHGNSVHFCKVLFYGIFLLVWKRTLLCKVTDKAVSEQILSLLKVCKNHTSSTSNVNNCVYDHLVVLSFSHSAFKPLSFFACFAFFFFFFTQFPLPPCNPYGRGCVYCSQVWPHSCWDFILTPYFHD